MTDFDITTVRKLTPLRNREKNPALRQRLTNIINTAENVNKETDPRHREKLIASFRKQWAEYEQHVAENRS